MDRKPVRVLLADDHPAVRQGLALLLAHNGMEVGVDAASAEAVLARLPSVEIDLAIVDLSFEHGDGFRLIAALHARSIPIVVYSMHEDRGHVERALARGADGYVGKREDTGCLLLGLTEVLGGRSYVSPRIARALDEVSDAAAVSRCSEREIEILQLLGKGVGNSAIAETLGLSVRTVETYCARVAEKLGLPGMRELRQFAIREYRPSEEN